MNSTNARWIITILVPVLFASQVLTQFSLLQSLSSVAKLIFEGGQQYDNEPIDQPNPLKEYDFIIVGAGTAGCVVANRLSENPKWKVLLIEAGAHENYLMDIPLFVHFFQLTSSDWMYKTQPDGKACLGLMNKQCNWPRGKVMGGSSVLNYMIYTRGNRRDYDTWEQMGNEGWGWNNVLEYFKKVESFDIPQFYNDQYHNREGPLNVAFPPYHTPIADAFVESAQYFNIPYVDYNGATQAGASILQTSLKNGTRHSSSRAYLHPIKNRKNLHVIKKTMVTKVLINPKTKETVGVEFVRDRVRQQIFARKEVILSAGTINSAQLLMVSGIGPKEDLERLNIPVLQDLRVGYNLQDHMTTGGLVFVVNQSVSLLTSRMFDPAVWSQYFMYHQGPLSDPGGCEALMFVDTLNLTNPDAYPDIEILMQGGSFVGNAKLPDDLGIDPQFYHSMYRPIEGKDTWMMWPMLLRPKSTGRVKLASPNPFRKPLIYPNYYDHPDDVATMVRGIKLALAINESPPFRKFDSQMYNVPLPACKKYGYGTDKYWECQARQLTWTIYHHTGTAKMGPPTDPTAVVDPRLRVYGIKGLRVIDASIMPNVPAAHTNAPTYMVAEKGSDMIKEDWGYFKGV